MLTTFFLGVSEFFLTLSVSVLRSSTAKNIKRNAFLSFGVLTISIFVFFVSLLQI